MIHSLVFSVTYKCPIKCKFCGVNAGPHRRGKMSLEMMKGLIDEACALGTIELIVFTGGEPFLLGKDLYKAIEYAANKELLTRIVTNAYWATSPEKAFKVLSELKKAGLTEINYSCDDFHQEFIPLERIKWASEAAAEVGIPALIASKGIKNSRIMPEYLEEFFGKKLTAYKEGCKNPTNFVYTYGATIPVGWESENLSEEDLLWPNDEDNWNKPCKSVLESIVVDSDGNLSICCGIGSVEVPETAIGNVFEKPMADLILEANNDLIVNWLALQGPYGIMKFIQSRAPDIPFKPRYVNVCHLCHDIFSREETRAALSPTALEVIPVLGLERAWVENNREQFTKLPSEECIQAIE